MIELSPDQNTAFGGIAHWLAARQEKFTTLAGLAGTGKTTMLRHVLAHAQDRGVETVVASFTGKAVSVLLSKGIPAQTLHSLLYKPVGGPSDMWLQARARWKSWQRRAMAATPEFTHEGQVEQAVIDGRYGDVAEYNDWKHVKDDYDESRDGSPKWERVESIDADLVIVDEASMVNNQLHEDLQRVAFQILYVGDHGQLEPIGANPKLMMRPRFRLEQIHRQAATSGIIPFAHHLRHGLHPLAWRSQLTDVHVTQDPGAAINHDVVICGFNKTRARLNHFLRQNAGIQSPMPVPGEPVICLRNNAEQGLFNGLVSKLLAVHPTKDRDLLSIEVENAEGTPVISTVLASQFGAEKNAQFVPRGVNLFDWAYALTAHKSQGSEFARVAVYEELWDRWDPRRWRYTAATRAAQHLTYISPA